MEKSRTTLDQWITLQAVVDYGGFAQAADALHRTQSSISYTINKLEQTLGIEILSLEKRRAVLTHEGKLLLELSRELTEKAISLEKEAKKLILNNKLKINILIDPLYISDLFLDKVSQFIKENKHYDINIHKISLSQSDVLSQKNQDLVITHHNIKSLQPIDLESIKTVLVTHPESALQQIPNSDLCKELQKHTYISLFRNNTDIDHNNQVIHVGSVETAISLVKHGLGYSRLPLAVIQEELNKNSIKQLNTHNNDKEYNFYLYLNKNSFPIEDIEKLLLAINSSPRDLIND
ncbi:MULTISPECIES: LysR family transcriptional regulator [Proteus]|jgi:DNA-binding transcriptional LysR family regulator|uniref:LysR-family transcriptional regulator n=1 Tax=Proteus vulgaris TaxID=585 RepID=A0A379F7Y8_PROVU|nr:MULTISPECIES: LysR family transcriptional regulator [Proteus]NBN58956.1 LysR family transcriptional regulator [Proteus sp. G2639]RNT22256.1 LysR family transcriptional regulator [Proteus mirabilis]AYY82699.1 LysR family transcriptional regulator [Proteus vulgaris]KGA55946.1 bacterial regulatory helix-turn-helix, lysR family protein [Proteus vulgaris]MBG5972830.1 LysR family transcriptional regulator [Proteus vulgaris]